jgi:hypothetical protein
MLLVGVLWGHISNLIYNIALVAVGLTGRANESLKRFADKPHRILVKYARLKVRHYFREGLV